MKENPVLRSLCERRSIKSYEARQISDEALQAVLQAGACAPSGRGSQSATMVVVQDADTRALLSRLNAQVLGNASLDPFYGAPTLVVVLGNPEHATWMEDGCLVMGNLLNAAPAVGLGACWIHRAKEVFAMPEGKALLRQWGLSETLVGIAHCTLGYPAGQPKPRAPRREGAIVFADRR